MSMCGCVWGGLENPIFFSFFFCVASRSGPERGFTPPMRRLRGTYPGGTPKPTWNGRRDDGGDGAGGGGGGRSWEDIFTI
jgi:hypothetical protein